MIVLSDWAHDRYSQGGEDGVMEMILGRLRIEQGVCVEFGAADGLSCSNTANLWLNHDWTAVLIEADEALHHRCVDNVTRAFGAPVVTQRGDTTEIRHAPDPERDTRVSFVAVVHRAVGRPATIDAILDDAGIDHVDVMSIDVDGDDYWIMAGLTRRPTVLVVEFNPTVPPHLDVRPRGPGNRMGVGILTLIRTAADRGYAFIGITGANAWFVPVERADVFGDLEVDPQVLLPPERFMYLATDQTGRMVPMGRRPEWGLTWPPSETVFVPNSTDLLEVEDSHAPLIGPLLAELRASRRETELALEQLRSMIAQLG